MNKSLIFIPLLFLAACGDQKSSQEETESTGYMKTVYAQCNNPDILEVETTIDGYIEVEYLCEGKRYEVGILDDEMLFLESNASQTEVPFGKIKEKLSKKYEGWKLEEFSKVKTNDTSYIKVEIFKEGIEQNIYFTNGGEKYKVKTPNKDHHIDYAAIAESESFQVENYNFYQPDSIYEMPDILREISGITRSDHNSVYAIQDELGVIFEYNFDQRKITQTIRFTDVGDFEDIARMDDLLYVLRSDGNIFVNNLKTKTLAFERMIQTNSLDIEGLFYQNDSLYLVCKGPSFDKPESSRMIYKTSANRFIKPTPYLEIKIPELRKYISEHYPEINSVNLQFNPSAIARHPITGSLFILSAEDQMISIYQNKKLINVIPLSPEVYYKPEGLEFHENGDLLISTEGDKKGINMASIFYLKYR